MKNIVFFNHWHYGDFFSTRGMVADIQRQLPNYRYAYAHNKNPLATRDLVNFDLKQPQIDHIMNGIDQRLRIAQSDDTIFVNTWVGAYEGMWQGLHPPYTAQYDIFKAIYSILNQSFNLGLLITNNIWDYIPEIDYTKIDTAIADALVADCKGKIYLFCNNPVMSKQSSMGDMKNMIETLAVKYPDDTFIVTDHFNTEYFNIKFTSEIFNKPNDLLEISYLSKFVNVIVGKNSSPYTYTQTKSNICDPTKRFICFSHDVSDTLTYGLNCSATFNFSNIVDEIDAVKIIDNGF
jgi:hypothetical protein